MVLKDESFKKKLRETFRLEAGEHLSALSSGLVSLEKAGDAKKKAEITETVFREAHSLKGSARVVSMTDIETVCQSLESVLAAVKRKELDLSAEMFDGLHAAVDNLGKLLAAMDRQRTPQEKALVVDTVRYLENILKGVATPLPKTSHAVAKEVETIAPAPVAAPRETPFQTETVRVATSRLESLLMQVEDMLSARQAAGQLSHDLEEVNSSLAAWRREWQTASTEISQLRSRLRSSMMKPENEDLVRRMLEFMDWNYGYYKSLEGRVSATTLAAKRDGNSLGIMLNEMNQDMKKILMSPFSSLAETFPRFLRDLSREQGKEIELVIRGEEIEIDRRILQEMKDPLIHLMRNCIDHGIEKPEVRRQKGKPARGTITLGIEQRGSSNIEIMVADDGKGIDIPAICKSCVKQGVISPNELGKLSEAESLALIWSGVSTRAVATELSGRGLGLAITREKVEKLRGTISVATQPEHGTTFRIVLPLTLAEFRGLVVRVNEQLLVIPTVNVERVVRVKKEAIKTVENRETISLDGQVISLVRLADVLELSSVGRGEDSLYMPALLLSLAGTRLAFLVDEIAGEQEVLVKGLGKQLRRVRNVAGASVLGNGKVVPVLNVADLMKSAIKMHAVPARAPVPPAKARQSILVVEDSITARTLLKNILETVGYRVRTAVDGMDALIALKAEKIDIVVSDVDMPRMNGFDLTAKIRADKKLAATPVVLVTALESREDRERGIDVGANAYIVKSSFDQGNLIEAIKKLI